MKPVCFLDVDGVINTVRPNEETGHTMVCEGFNICMPKTTKENIERLSEYFDMVWLTTWEHKANTHFTPFWGLEEWPVVEWNTRRKFSESPNKIVGAIHWFNEHGNRPWVMIDDDAYWHWGNLSEGDVEALPGDRLLLAPDHWIGMTDAHVEEAVQFAESLNERRT